MALENTLDLPMVLAIRRFASTCLLFLLHALSFLLHVSLWFTLFDFDGFVVEGCWRFLPGTVMIEKKTLPENNCIR